MKKKAVKKKMKQNELTEKRFSVLEGGLIELEAALFLMFVLLIWEGARGFLFSFNPWCYFGAWVFVFGFLVYRLYKE